jgi:hypothetical protein
MKKLFAILLTFTFLQSCDDGDIIVTTFNFDNVDLKTCGEVGDYVFYKVNTQSFESLSLKLGVSEDIYEEPGIKTYPLAASTNFVNYRRYDGPLQGNYFCSSIPPTSPEVIEDYRAVSGSAIVTVTFELNDEDPTEVFKNIQITLKDIVMIQGDEQIIIESLNMGSIENVRL